MCQHQVDGAIWHRTCLVCTMCSADLVAAGSGFRCKGAEPYCRACYEAKFCETCGGEGCGKPVEEGITALGKSWHRDCFKCSSCQAPLAGEPFRQKENEKGERQPFCEPCYASTHKKGLRQKHTFLVLPSGSLSC